MVKDESEPKRYVTIEIVRADSHRYKTYRITVEEKTPIVLNYSAGLSVTIAAKSVSCI